MSEVLPPWFAGRKARPLAEPLLSGRCGPPYFWAAVLGEKEMERIEDDNFAQGFVEGALAVWRQVRCKL